MSEAKRAPPLPFRERSEDAQRLPGEGEGYQPQREEPHHRIPSPGGDAADLSPRRGDASGNHLSLHQTPPLASPRLDRGAHGRRNTILTARRISPRPQPKPDGPDKPPPWPWVPRSSRGKAVWCSLLPATSPVAHLHNAGAGRAATAAPAAPRRRRAKRVSTKMGCAAASRDRGSGAYAPPRRSARGA
jgi:hypothetical protein